MIRLILWIVVIAAVVITALFGAFGAVAAFNHSTDEPVLPFFSSK